MKYAVKIGSKRELRLLTYWLQDNDVVPSILYKSGLTRDKKDWNNLGDYIYICFDLNIKMYTNQTREFTFLTGYVIKKFSEAKNIIYNKI